MKYVAKNIFELTQLTSVKNLSLSECAEFEVQQRDDMRNNETGLCSRGCPRLQRAFWRIHST